MRSTTDATDRRSPLVDLGNGETVTGGAPDGAPRDDAAAPATRASSVTVDELGGTSGQRSAAQSPNAGRVRAGHECAQDRGAIDDTTLIEVALPVESASAELLASLAGTKDGSVAGKDGAPPSDASESDPSTGTISEATVSGSGGGRGDDDDGEDSDDEDSDDEDSDDDFLDGDPLVFPVAEEWPPAGVRLRSQAELEDLCDPERLPMAATFAVGRLATEHHFLDETKIRALLRHRDSRVSALTSHALGQVPPALAARAAALLIEELSGLEEYDITTSEPNAAERLDAAFMALENLARKTVLDLSGLAAAGEEIRAEIRAIVDHADESYSSADSVHGLISESKTPHREKMLAKLLVTCIQCDRADAVGAGAESFFSRLHKVSAEVLRVALGFELHASINSEDLFEVIETAVSNAAGVRSIIAHDFDAFEAAYRDENDPVPSLANLFRPSADEMAARRAREIVDDTAVDALSRALSSKTFESAIEQLCSLITVAARRSREEDPSFAPIAVAWTSFAEVARRRGTRPAFTNDRLLLVSQILALGLFFVIRGRWPFRNTRPWAGSASPDGPRREIALLDFDAPWIDSVETLRVIAEHADPQRLETLATSSDEWVRRNALLVLAARDPERHIGRALVSLPDWHLKGSISDVIEVAGDRALGALFDLETRDAEKLDSIPPAVFLIRAIALLGTERGRAVVLENYDSLLMDPNLDASDFIEMICASGSPDFAGKFLSDLRSGTIDLGVGPLPGEPSEPYENDCIAEIETLIQLYSLEDDAKDVFKTAIANGAHWSPSDDDDDDDDDGGNDRGDTFTELGDFRATEIHPDELSQHLREFRQREEDFAGSPGITFYREEPKVGRNDPCPCGSGKKYKKCHGAAS
jgi:hypothetical protein